jgi:class 3 adenylate cyclase
MTENNHPMESDRRLVTVMFADISGFTAMSEKMDPEEVTEVMKDCFSMMGECIEEHGGTIDKFMGDSVMVLFGAPKAQEDAHARCHALVLSDKFRMFQHMIISFQRVQNRCSESFDLVQYKHNTL